jgi:hypothetical protein
LAAGLKWTADFAQMWLSEINGFALNIHDL